MESGLLVLIPEGQLGDVYQRGDLHAKSCRDVAGHLNSLFTAENLKLPNWEVLVVETSTDNTIEVCREFQRQFPRHFRFLTEKKLGKSHALNTAVVAAKGDVLAFIDDDVICDANYIN